MSELYADTRFGPGDVPADATLVLVWDEETPPSAWRVIAVGTGFATLDDLLRAAGDQFPELDGKNVMATRVGGSSSRIRQLVRTEQRTVSVELV